MRKFVLTIHVITSVGWVGAAAAYVVLAVDVLVNKDVESVRAMIRVMELIAWIVVIPLALASLVTGIIQSLGTVWGLFRHYWVLYKFLLSLVSLFLLQEYGRSMVQLGRMAANTNPSAADVNMMRDPGHLVHSGGGLMVLLVATVLATYKPRGLTPYGQRKQREQRSALQASKQPQPGAALSQP
jgi:hypothetical protein